MVSALGVSVTGCRPLDRRRIGHVIYATPPALGDQPPRETNFLSARIDKLLHPGQAYAASPQRGHTVAVTLALLHRYARRPKGRHPHLYTIRRSADGGTPVGSVSRRWPRHGMCLMKQRAPCFSVVGGPALPLSSRDNCLSQPVHCLIQRTPRVPITSRAHGSGPRSWSACPDVADDRLGEAGRGRASSQVSR